MSDDNEPKKNYAIGYGKPPKSGQFKPGKSGNSKGRPKGAKNVKTLVNKVMGERIEITEAGKNKKMPKVEALVRKTFALAMKGDAKARIHLFSMLESDETSVEDLGSLTAIEMADIREFAARTAPVSAEPAAESDGGTETSHGDHYAHADDEEDEDDPAE